VVGLDRPGLLFELTNTLSDLNLDITSAHITTSARRPSTCSTHRPHQHEITSPSATPPSAKLLAVLE